jgi:hypothetical protein
LGGDTVYLPNPLQHMHRNPHGSRLIVDRSCNRLAYPPSCVGPESEASAMVKSIDRLQEADVAFLD